MSTSVNHPSEGNKPLHTNKSNLPDDIWSGCVRHVQSLSGFENMQILDVRPGYAKAQILVTPEALNLYGQVHGGFLFALCDMISGMATYAYGVANVTLQSNINFIKAAHPGILTVTSNVEHKGRKTAVNHVEILNEDKALIATASFTMYITKEL